MVEDVFATTPLDPEPIGHPAGGNTAAVIELYWRRQRRRAPWWLILLAFMAAIFPVTLDAIWDLVLRIEVTSLSA